MKRFRIDGKYEYCPNGNYWQEVSGIFDKQIYLFCELDVNVMTIYRYIKAGRLKAYKLGKEFRISRKEFSSFLNEVVTK